MTGFGRAGLIFWGGMGVLALVPTRHASAQSADEIIEKCIAASGGYDALNQVKSVERKGTIELTLFRNGPLGKTHSILIPWKKFYEFNEVDMFSQKHAWNGSESWEDGMQGLRKLRDDETGLLRLQSALNPLVGYQMLRIMGYVITREGDASVGTEENYAIQMVPSQGLKLKFQISKKTWLLTQSQLSLELPRLGISARMIVENSDYKPYGKIRLPGTVKVKLGEIMSYEASYTETKVDGPLDEKIFDMPKPASAQPASPAPSAPK